MRVFIIMGQDHAHVTLQCGASAGSGPHKMSRGVRGLTLKAWSGPSIRP